MTSANEVILALQTATKQLSAYPAGHPARTAAVATAQARLTELLGPTGGLVIGIARDSLQVGEQKFDSAPARSLARSLFQKNLALLRVQEGVERGEIEALLTLMAEPAGAPISFQDGLKAAGVVHVSAESLDYSTLAVTDEVSADATKPSGDLWTAILDALLQGKQLSPEGAAALAGETYSAGAAAALVTGKPDVLESAVAGYLARTSGGARPAAIRQVAELFRALPEDLKQRLLDSAFKVLTTEDKDDGSLRELVAQVPADAALKAMRQLAQAGARLSPHAMRLLQTLMAAAQRAHREQEESQPGSPEATRAIVSELLTLFQDEDVDRFNPDDHASLLDSAAIDPQRLESEARVAELGERGDSLTEAALERTLVHTLLELLSTPETPLLDAPLERLHGFFRESLESGQVDRAIEIVDAVRAAERDAGIPAASKRRLGEFLAQLADANLLAALLNAPQRVGANPAQVKALIARLGSAASRALLESLAGEQDQKRRRRLFDLIVSLGNVIVPDATRMLRDTRWYVVRNMIVLLRRVGDKSSLPEVRRCAEDRDLRVRLEAIKTLLIQDPSVPRGLLDKAILHPDPTLAESAVVLVGQYGIKEGTEPLLSILMRWDVFGSKRSLRLKAIKALSELGDPSVLPRLDRFFRAGLFPPVALEERRAAWKALDGYPEDSRRPLVDRGLYSRDSVIRDLCQRLLRSAPPVADRTLVPSARPPSEAP